MDGVFIIFCIHLNAGNHCLSSQQQASGHYPQVANETLSLHFSGFVPVFQRTEVTWSCCANEEKHGFWAVQQRRHSQKCKQKAMLGREANFYCQKKWKWWVLETDQTHEVPQREMNFCSSLVLCAKALGWIAEHRLCLQGWTRTSLLILKIPLLCVHYLF